MVIIKILGGLGNQMFQYAFYEIFNNKSVAKLDTSSFDMYSLHNGLEIEKVFGLNLKKLESSKEEKQNFKDNYPCFKLRKVLGFLFFKSKNTFLKSSHYVEENYSEFSPSLFKLKNVYLEGYWQNERYLLENRALLLKLFTWNNVAEKNRDLAIKMSQENSVSIHIRRLDKPKTWKELLYRVRLSLIWRVAKDQYYFKAIDYINNNVENAVFYIFTDNVAWVNKNISPNIEAEIVDWNRGKESNQDMFLMTRCKHNIISMSTFSWWGAWLNNNKNKIVVAPAKWSVRLEKNKGILPKSWIKL